MIKTRTYPVNNITLANEILEIYINSFWQDVFSTLDNDKHLLIMCKVEFSDSELGYRTLGHLRKVNFNDKDLFIEYLSARLGYLTDAYTTHPISKLTFSYIIKSGLAVDHKNLLQDYDSKGFTTHRFNNMNLPISMEPSDYGTVIATENNVTAIYNGGQVTVNRFIVRNGTRIYTIDASLDGLTNNVTIEGAADLSWVDTKISENIFKRDIGKSSNYFMDGVKVLRKKELSAKPFTKLSTDKTLANNFVTMDIETIKQGSKLIPYLICAYNGTDYISSYTSESLNQKSLVSSFIYQLVTFFKKDSKTLIVYAHNLSGFDGTFILKYILEFGKVEPVLFNGKLMSIKLRLNIDGYKNKTIIFKDSYLLLPISLRKLCLAFNVDSPKGYFPFNFTNVFYAGMLPAYECWKDISKKVYNNLLEEYKGKNWNFELEAIKYCKLDCKCLFEILVQFNNLIFNNFNVNIHKSLTLPSLAMRIYKSQFMPKNQIYQIGGAVERDIRQSYTGGAVDVYIPHNRKSVDSLFSQIKTFFTTLYYYDVNSLYPFVMSSTAMPIGKPVAFEGNIRKIDPKAYGFFYCKITSPEYLDHPILQRRIKTENGIRTVAGLGSWYGWIYSAEMDNAVRFGYQFEILRGYEFKMGFIFKDYVNKMYNLRLEYDKSHPMNLIAKLLMNSLYGKFGMKLENTIIEMFDTSNEIENDLLKKMVNTYGMTIQDFIKIDNKLLTVRNSVNNCVYYNDDEVDTYHGVDVNIAIASAVTAGGRMWMSLFKNNPNFNLYYSDTDSGIVDAPLPVDMVGGGLGQFKLEYIIKRAVFLAPKVYGFITDENDKIIKIKGVKTELIDNINIQDLESLLIKDSSREFIQEKWFKNITKGEIPIDDIIYTLKVTSNKRKHIYNNEIFSNTKPYNYDEINSKKLKS